MNRRCRGSSVVLRRFRIFASRSMVVDNWFLWAVKHGVAPSYPQVFPAVPDPALMGVVR